MAASKSPLYAPRRGSASSERDFFDLPDEPILAVAKRQLRHIRTWVVFGLFVLFIFWLRHKPAKPPLPHIRYDLVDWSRYAYTQYATSSPYLCNSIMIFESLHRLGSRAERVLFYPYEWDLEVDDSSDRDSQLLVMARDKYNVQTVPIDIQMIKGGSGSTESWDTSISKFLAFGETQYERVIHLDSDSTVLQNMDELFFLPSAQVAMPRAFWELPHTKQLSSQLIVLEPSHREYYALMEEAKPAMYGQVDTSNNDTHQYDMDILDKRYGNSALVLPHRQYSLITGEFRNKDHRRYLGNEYETWDPDRALAEAKLIHFSDWPLPKPWVMWPRELLTEVMPKCDYKPGTAEESGCRDRAVWKKLYDDFRRRRKHICRLLSYPAPDWPPRENNPQG